MNPRKALLQALMTVGGPTVLIWGFVFYGVGVHADEWSIYFFFILVPVFFLFPLVYRRYRLGPHKKPATRNEYLKHGVLASFVAALYIAMLLGHAHTGWRAVADWLCAVVWPIVAFDYFRRASRANKDQVHTA